MRQVKFSVVRVRGGLVVMLALLLGLSLAVSAETIRPVRAAAVVSAVSNRGTAGVTADALPTVQINGIVWTQVVVGNTVYAGGQFSTARPAGAAPGTSTVRRYNLLAFDIRTGKLITSFAPVINGAVRALAVSPDNKTLYVGGAFTAVNGKKRLRFAALSTFGALRLQAQSFNKDVHAIAAVGSTVYVGGAFTKVGKYDRSRLASLAAGTGALKSWNPNANSTVLALTLTPNRTSLVVGGNFSRIGSSANCGMSRLSLGAGKVQSWPINTVIKNCGMGTAIMSLKTSGSAVYGSGYSTGKGNYEGAFAATGTGQLKWLQDCRGDTYDVAVAAGRVYSVGHAHNCANIGGFPEAKPRTHYRALAVSTGATGSITTSPGGYRAFTGKPSPSLVNWFPSLTPGTFTGKTQAAWSVAATGSYVVLGGEFTAVNGAGQQGLVRMAVPSIAPLKQGPQSVTDSSANPSANIDADGSVTVSWPTAWDRDDQTLTYTLLRDGAPVNTRTATSRFWQRTTLTYRDAALSPGTKYRWKVQVSDPDGNSVTSASVSVTTPASEPTPEPTPSASPVGTPSSSDTATPSATPSN